MREEAAEPEEQHHRRPLQQQLRGRLSSSVLPSSSLDALFQTTPGKLKKLVLLHSSYRILCPECNKSVFFSEQKKLGCFLVGVLSTRPTAAGGRFLSYPAKTVGHMYVRFSSRIYVLFEAV